MAGDERGRADPRVLPGIEICPLRAATTWRPIYPSVREGWPATIRQMREHRTPFRNAFDHGKGPA
jgi:hypothetical protein